MLHSDRETAANASTELLVFCDRRWPTGTGIGVVMHELESRRPSFATIVDLDVKSRLGSPWSPAALSASLLRKRLGQKGIFVNMGFIPPLFAGLPRVVIVHDLTHRKYYGQYKRLYYDCVLKFLYRHCRIVCVSEYVRCEFLEWSGIAPERVNVVRNGCTPIDNSRERPRLFTFPYVLYPGNRRSYKNLRNLLQAYSLSRLPREGVRLVLTGPPDEVTQRYASTLGIDQSVIFCGVLEPDQLASAYQDALAVTFVSLSEGFGLPIIESMSAGTPVLTSNVSAMPETSGGAALLVDPLSVATIREGLERIVFDHALRANLVEAGLMRAKDFEWDQSAKQFWDIVIDEFATFWRRRDGPYHTS
jgi:glycosyltransferase involved in cell wall biosynthesis